MIQAPSFPRPQAHSVRVLDVLFFRFRSWFFTPRHSSPRQTTAYHIQNFGEVVSRFAGDKIPPKSRPTLQKYVARTFNTEWGGYAQTRMKSRFSA